MYMNFPSSKNIDNEFLIKILKIIYILSTLFLFVMIMLLFVYYIIKINRVFIDSNDPDLNDRYPV